ncbi:unnamed protein product [Allacma fusca]|uniref:Glucosidase 2 subunit beta n=1 Tax=Allacma fusca TaxID=39272 RepID=A0A8J2KTF6_9HEXA|nr:unnamed protein product [Allacma fusca]
MNQLQRLGSSSFLSINIGLPAQSLSLVIILSFLFNRFVISDDRLTPRGVPLSRGALYDPQKDFSCLDGSKLIPFSFVNDDYCDCEDGSDEPGTSACSNGYFYCLNAGHIPLNIRTSRVNDGICDCCDGSDEFDGTVTCSNTCLEMGRAAREENERKARLARDGYQKRIEMSQQGKDSRRSKEEERSKLEVDLQQAESQKEDKQRVKEEVEAPEKEALEKHRQLEEEKRRKEDEEEKSKSEAEAENIFNLLDSNEDGLITADEIKTRQTFDRNKDGAVSDEEALFFLNMENEMSKDEFMKTGWILFKPYFLIESGMFQPPQPEGTDEETATTQEPPAPEPVTEPPPLDADENINTDYEDDELEDSEKSESSNLPEDDESEDDDTKLNLESEDTDATRVDLYDEPTRLLIEAADKARQEFHDAERAVRDVKNKLQELNDALSLDLGDDDRFGPLFGQCFDLSDREYTYTLCPFQKSNQRGVNGGGEVHLGKWNAWSGPENDKYTSMLYDGGQACWNGPARSVKVNVQCGTENKILSVSEPSRCVYEMEFSTPAACQRIESATHDEL